MTKLITSATILTTLVLTGCAKSDTATAHPDANAPVAQTAEPDRDRLHAHMADHVQYPADRSAILAACADTPEFTDAEKAWFEAYLPEGDYAGPDEVLATLPE